MNTKHIIGFVLLGLGILVIGYALFSSHAIFTGNTDAPKLFEEPVVQEEKSSLGTQDVEQQIDALLQQQLGKILPAGTISEALNLFAWSIFAGILIFGGTQLASLGIKLLRTPIEGSGE